MRRRDIFLPWLILWLPAVLALTVPAALMVRAVTSAPPLFRSVVGEVPSVPLAALRTTPPVSGKPMEPMGAWNPFLKPLPMVSEPMGGEDEPKERVRLSSIFLVEGRRLCLVNGLPYEEGGRIAKNAMIGRIEANGVVIRRDDGEEVFLGVGDETDL